MASQGAKHLLLLSRSGANSAAALRLISDLEAEGIEIRAPVCDVSSAESLASVLDESALTMPPVKGCIQSAMVLKVSGSQPPPMNNFGVRSFN